MALCNIPSTIRDPAYRYTMPCIMVKVEGSGIGKKTRIMNMGDVAHALQRPPQYITTWFGHELGAQSKYTNKPGEGERATINGVHEMSVLRTHLDKFIEKYVLCPHCNLPEIPLKVEKTICTQCRACGWSGDLDNRHKLAAFIMKNPPDTSGLSVVDANAEEAGNAKKIKRAAKQAAQKQARGGVDKAEDAAHPGGAASSGDERSASLSRTVQKDKGGQEDKNSKKDKKAKDKLQEDKRARDKKTEGQIDEVNGKKEKTDKKERKDKDEKKSQKDKKSKQDKNDDEKDVSERNATKCTEKLQGQKEGKKEGKGKRGGRMVESDSSDSASINGRDSIECDDEVKQTIVTLRQFVEEAGGMPSAAAFFEELRMHQLAKTFDNRVRLYVALEALMSISMSEDEVEKHSECLDKAITMGSMDSFEVLWSFDTYLFANSDAVKRFPMVLKTIYDNEWCSGEAILEYYNGDSGIGEPGFETAKARAKQFLQWLEQEDNESTDSGDESSG